MRQPKIETARLILRRWRDEDHAPFAKICADPDVMTFIGDGLPRTTEQTSEAIASFERDWSEKSYGVLAVELRDTRELIGSTGLSFPGHLPEILPSVEIGWRYGKAHWGRGYATEAAAAVLSFAVDDLRLRNIVSICQTGNTASTRVMVKLGLVFDRTTLNPACNREVFVYRLP